MTFEGLGEMFEGDSADTIGGKFPLMLMGGQAESLACAKPEARTPIGMSGNLISKHNFLLSELQILSKPAHAQFNTTFE